MKKIILVVLLLLCACATPQVKKYPSSSLYYHYMLAHIYIDKHETIKAKQEYEWILKNSKDALFYEEYARFLIREDPERSIQLLKEAIAINPNRKSAYLLLSDLLLQLSKVEESVSVLKEASHKFHDADIYLRWGLITMGKGDIAESLKVLREGLSFNPDDTSLLFYIALEYKEKHLYGTALSYAKKAYKIDENSTRLALLVGDIYGAEGKLKKMVSFYESALDKVMDKVPLLIELSRAYGKLNMPKKEEQMYERLLKHREDIDVMERLGIIYIKRGEYKKAVDILSKLQEIESSNRVGYFLGLAYYLKEDYSKALNLFSQIEVGSDFYSAGVERTVDIYKKEKKMGKAIEVLNKAIDLKPLDSQLYFLLASLYGEKKDWQRVISILEEGMNRMPLNVNFPYYLADVYFEDLHDVSKAVDYLKKTLSVDPNNASVLNYLGYLYIDENMNIAEGIKLVEKALSISPNNGYYLDSLGWGYYRQNNYMKALQYLEKALKVVKNEPVIMLHLAKVYMKLNRKKEAIDVLNRILKIKPGDKDARKFLQSIQK
ncbi:MAG: tetratricopeptide repeat protein [Deltaproteobacteria bacterium]|nr:tetratricopeptide repeat protein [Deltaproteobacteria bacterium]